MLSLQARQALHTAPRHRHQTCHRQRAVNVYAAVAAPPQAETRIAGDVSQLIGVLSDPMQGRSSCGCHVEVAVCIASSLQAMACVSLPWCHATRQHRDAGQNAGSACQVVCWQPKHTHSSCAASLCWWSFEFCFPEPACTALCGELLGCTARHAVPLKDTSVSRCRSGLMHPPCMPC